MTHYLQNEFRNLTKSMKEMLHCVSPAISATARASAMQFKHALIYQLNNLCQFFLYHLYHLKLIARIFVTVTVISYTLLFAKIALAGFMHLV